MTFVIAVVKDVTTLPMKFSLLKNRYTKGEKYRVIEEYLSFVVICRRKKTCNPNMKCS